VLAGPPTRAPKGAPTRAPNLGTGGHRLGHQREPTSSTDLASWSVQTRGHERANKGIPGPLRFQVPGSTYSRRWSLRFGWIRGWPLEWPPTGAIVDAPVPANAGPFCSAGSVLLDLSSVTNVAAQGTPWEPGTGPGEWIPESSPKSSKFSGPAWRLSPENQNKQNMKIRIVGSCKCR
jgi:hypothetical protein